MKKFSLLCGCSLAGWLFTVHCALWIATSAKLQLQRGPSQPQRASHHERQQSDSLASPSGARPDYHQIFIFGPSWSSSPAAASPPPSVCLCVCLRRRACVDLEASGAQGCTLAMLQCGAMLQCEAMLQRCSGGATMIARKLGSTALHSMQCNAVQCRAAQHGPQSVVREGRPAQWELIIWKLNNTMFFHPRNILSQFGPSCSLLLFGLSALFVCLDAASFPASTRPRQSGNTAWNGEPTPSHHWDGRPAAPPRLWGRT